mmetsp:Transcript_7835/g.11990  ORF Transcript_7835/g.11990 Transcript_7835/m.11990 type:complete len:380 (+) Transcript_7835:167-1306(+)|eukprot:CAMPEP_0178920248 /NCGR_PEP_ID=MMETSP0786-20121207/14900_1 /TAXON_ID=186022 /ORGANISM="Thalassionema frauenfeldii, Strain CCMP 1798" /LENGTH=379 /DNA_ID=CAMNT_0020594295 /DNA_START=130 /DNA_END=1269 /DNA_ORIENTATION=+
MPATAIGRINIPPGWDYDVGVSFEKNSKPIKVETVKKGGPMWGKLREGYLVHGIILGDNRKVEGINGTQLKNLLESTSKSKDRKLLVQVAFPNKLEIDIGKGDTGKVGFEQAGDKVLLRKIHDDDLRKRILPGMQLASIFFEDVGVEVAGYKWSEIAPCLKGSDCKITLCNPTRPAPKRKTILPQRLDLDLPPNVADLGLTIVKQPKVGLRINGISLKSPCFLGAQGKLLKGMVIKTLLVDNYVFDDLGTVPGLASAVKDTKGRPSRMLMLEQVGGRSVEDIPVQRVAVARMNRGLNIEYTGGKRQLKVTSSDNPKIKAGQHIVGMVDANGTEYQEMEDYELRELLETTKTQKIRYLMVRDGDWHDEIVTSHANDEAAA